MDAEGWYRCRTRALFWMAFGYLSWFIQLLISTIQNWSDSNDLYVKIWITIYITYLFIKLFHIITEMAGKIIWGARIINIIEYMLFISGNIMVYTLNMEPSVLFNQMEVISLMLGVLLAFVILGRLIGKIMCLSYTLELKAFFKIFLDFEIPVILFIGFLDIIYNRISQERFLANMDYQEIRDIESETVETKTNTVDIESLKSYPFDNNNAKSSECSICLTAYENKEIIIELPCWHIFHKGCISPWLKREVTCPICRENVCHEGP
jgi:hypothetical protein